MLRARGRGTPPASTEEDGVSERVLGDRRKALEEEFFKKESEKLRARLREQADRETARAALAEASGIGDAEVLDRLVQLGMSAETFAALSLVPLVEVAWASGKVEPQEREEGGPAVCCSWGQD